MKIMRSIPFLALVFLGIIFFTLYKTGVFINKKVEKETLLAQDSLVQNPANALQTVNDTIASIVTPPESLLSAPNTEGGQTPTDASPLTATQPVKTILPTKSPEAKTEVKKPSKADIAKQKAVRKDSVSMKPDAETFRKSKALEQKAVTELRYHVIIGSYSKEANAKVRAAQFEQKHFKKATVAKQGGFYRVCADEFEFAQAASQYAQKLKEGGEDNMVLKF